jgi:4-hydroxybenzoate polyprenyltransferase
MRSSGCAYNDYIDRDIDKGVARTANRPIPTGDVTPEEALAFAVVLALLAFIVLVQFNAFTIELSMLSLVPVALYPFAKRYTNWAQAVLGLTFNWGALVGWTAVKGSLAYAPIALYLGAVLWTIGYDTIYALQDREDDAAMGVKSTALRFGADTPSWLGYLYAGALVLWTIAGFLAGTHLIFFATIALVALQMAWQITTLDINDTDNAMRRFRSNSHVGVALTIGLAADMALSSLAGLA